MLNFLKPYFTHPVVTALIVTWGSSKHLPNKYILLGTLFLFLKPYIKRKFVPLLMVISSGWVIYNYKTILDIEAALSLLVVLQGLKYLETKGNRGFFSFYAILVFILQGIVLFEQTLVNGIILASSVVLILTGLLKINNPKKISLNIALRSEIKWIPVSALLVVALYFLFPRYDDGFKRFDKKFGDTGFSEEASPGELDQVTLSDKTLFRAIVLKGEMPILPRRYWVGNIIWDTNGYKWKNVFPPPSSIQTRARNENLRVQIKSNLMLNNYLFGIDSPIGISQTNLSVTKRGHKTFKLQKTNPQKITYVSHSKKPEGPYQLSRGEKIRSLNTKNIPLSPRLESLIEKLNNDNQTISVENILKHFSEAGFKYTLKPGRTNNLEQFLFDSKLGYCTHFASAFSILARLMGIPSRVVVGMQGGKFNPYGEYYQITGKDSHAWSEVYLEGIWRRIDPTESVQPMRTSMGGQDFFAISEDGENIEEQNALMSNWKNAFKSVSLYFDMLDNRFANFFHSFDSSKQKYLAEILKLEISYFYSLTFLIPLIALAVYGLYSFRQQLKRRKGPLEHSYQQFLKKLKKFNINWPHHRPIRELITVEKLNNIEGLGKTVKMFESLRYGPPINNGHAIKILRQTIKELKIKNG